MNETTAGRVLRELASTLVVDEIPAEAASPPTPRPRLVDLVGDRFETEALAFFRAVADRSRQYERRIAEVTSQLGVQATDMAVVTGERDRTQAQLDAARTVIRELEAEIQATRAREASALEQVGVMKGMMISHGSAITEVFSKMLGTAQVGQEPAAAYHSGPTASQARQPDAGAA